MKIGNILWGLLFIILGVIFGLNGLGLTDINVFFDGWWTLIIIIPCFIGLFSEKDKTGNLVGLLIGVVLLLCMQDMIDFAILKELIVPAILLVIGFSIIFKDAINHGINKKIKELNKNGLEEYCATFSEQKVEMLPDEFKGASLTAVFGSVNFDFTNSKIVNDQIINASAIFGGITIYAPQEVNIKIKSTPIFGGVSDKTNKKYNPDLKTIYINAFSLFGGVDVK